MMIERILMVLKGTTGVPHSVFYAAWGMVGLALLGGYILLTEVLA